MAVSGGDVQGVLGMEEAMKIVMPTGRVYILVNSSNKPNCIGTLRLLETGSASNSNAPIYKWPKK